MKHKKGIHVCDGTFSLDMRKVFCGGLTTPIGVVFEEMPYFYTYRVYMFGLHEYNRKQYLRACWKETYRAEYNGGICLWNGGEES